MINWVAELTAKAVGIDHTYVVTDHEDIARAASSENFKFVMTSKDALTGTDRIAEAAQHIDADIYINVQGDEPLLDPASIVKVVEEAKKFPDCIINGYAPLTHNELAEDLSIPIVVLRSDECLLYMSRAALPARKDLAQPAPSYYKQVCIYAFKKNHLDAFANAATKAPAESYEDIEILRFLDIGYKVKMVRLPGNTIAVDHPSDIELVECQMNAK